MAKLTQEELWEMIGFIKISPSRYLTLKTLSDSFLMPSEIARKSGMATTQVSNALYDLKRKDLVVCLNEKSHKGRIYQNTQLALDILEILDKAGS
ncbi:MAG: MarR family transcriptional regulator [Methanobrevibacter sp.]|uniref:MarR family transcriptional regulator n=1 Tax=Methanobrevibacter sp. TaxID=66852 RepID=UPI0025EA7327|nr:MarR family transcriptional regulator [Methanobrevibacter sp.]MBQ6100248.1 MarR family transcriptional regulator [Methanobrevibacter sp.]